MRIVGLDLEDETGDKDDNQQNIWAAVKLTCSTLLLLGNSTAKTVSEDVVMQF